MKATGMNTEKFTTFSKFVTNAPKLSRKTNSSEVGCSRPLYLPRGGGGGEREGGVGCRHKVSEIVTFFGRNAREFGQQQISKQH